jgi:hypothetical protein
MVLFSRGEEDRLLHLDRICAELEAKILAGRGDTEAMRREWRATQDEMKQLERGGKYE